MLESKLAADGSFINGLETPTTADLVVLCLCKCSHIYGATIKASGIDLALEYPKMSSLANKTALVPNIANYLTTSVSFKADPMGVDV